MPSSVKDRFTSSWEYLLLFSKTGKYYFDLNAVREPHKQESVERTKRSWQGHREKMSSWRKMDMSKMCHPLGKNPADMWTIPTKGFKGAHFAVFPEKLLERPIQSGCPQFVCKKCGTPKLVQQSRGIVFGCSCKTGFTSGIVLDPFMGSGTTAIVAKRLGRRFIGFELNPEYVKMAEERIKGMLTKAG